MTTTTPQSSRQDIADQLIRDLVAAYPDVVTVLAPYGIDLCCGGSHPLGEALDLHGIPREPVLTTVAQIMARQPGRS